MTPADMDRLEALYAKANDGGNGQWLPITDADLDFTDAVHAVFPALLEAARKGLTASPQKEEGK